MDTSKTSYWAISTWIFIVTRKGFISLLIESWPESIHFCNTFWCQRKSWLPMPRLDRIKYFCRCRFKLTIYLNQIFIVESDDLSEFGLLMLTSLLFPLLQIEHRPFLRSFSLRQTCRVSVQTKAYYCWTSPNIAINWLNLTLATVKREILVAHREPD